MRTLVFTICVSMLFVGCCGNAIDIKVKKILSTSLDRYYTAKISVRGGDFESGRTSDSSSENARSYIGTELFGILYRSGITVSYGETDAVDLRVECLFRRRIGCPHVGRHFNVEFKHTSFVNLKFIDLRANEIIGEVECKRSFFKRLSAKYITLMFDELMKSPR